MNWTTKKECLWKSKSNTRAQHLHMALLYFFHICYSSLSISHMPNSYLLLFCFFFSSYYGDGIYTHTYQHVVYRCVLCAVSYLPVLFCSIVIVEFFSFFLSHFMARSLLTFGAVSVCVSASCLVVITSVLCMCVCVNVSVRCALLIQYQSYSTHVYL